MTNEKFEPIRIRIINSVKVMCGDVQRLIQREWVGLTDEEVGRLAVFDGLHHVETPLLAEYIRHIEAKLKEKNGG